MKEEFEILKQLSPIQRAEFDNDIRQLFAECADLVKGNLQKLKDVTVNLNLSDEVYLKVVCTFDSYHNDKVMGKIIELYKYKTKAEYDVAVAVERASLN